jgi:hypothetical protein
MPPLSTECVRDLGGLAALRPEWRALWRRCPAATPFQSPAWLLPWWRHLGGGELLAIAVRDGERLVGDGPLAATKEQLAGFYLLECQDLDEAIEWAAKIPGAQSGTVEIRPEMDYEARRAGQGAGAEASQV